MKKKAESPKTPLGWNFENLRKRWNLNYTKLEIVLGLGKGVISTYRKRGSTPRMESLMHIERITGISVYRFISEIIPMEEIPPSPLAVSSPVKVVSENSQKYGETPLIDATELAVRIMRMEADIRDLKRRVTELGG